jgi:outer membrane protein
MKKLLFAAVTALSMFTATAQNKMGYINANELLGSMPEAVKAEASLKEYEIALNENYRELVIEFNAADSAFNVDSSKLSEQRKEIKRKELFEKYQKVQNFQQTSQEDMRRKQEELLAPIREKAINAINTTAKANGYGYIFNEETLLVKPAGDNIINLVKANLGIKPPAPKPAGAAPKPAVRR